MFIWNTTTTTDKTTSTTFDFYKEDLCVSNTVFIWWERQVIANCSLNRECSVFKEIMLKLGKEQFMQNVKLCFHGISKMYASHLLAFKYSRIKINKRRKKKTYEICKLFLNWTIWLVITFCNSWSLTMPKICLKLASFFFLFSLQTLRSLVIIKY